MIFIFLILGFVLGVFYASHCVNKFFSSHSDHITWKGRVYVLVDKSDSVDCDSDQAL